MAEKPAIPSILDPKKLAPAKRVRRSVEQLIKDHEEKLARMKAQKAKRSVKQSIKDGTCADPATAVRLEKEIRGLAACRDLLIEEGIATATTLDSLADALAKDLEKAVSG